MYPLLISFQRWTGTLHKTGKIMKSDLVETINSVAISNYPNEMVGYVKDETFFELKNISKDPQNRYQLSLQDKMFLYTHNIDALVHSHTRLDNRPSQLDLAAQSATQFCFWIVGTNGKEVTKIKEIK